MKTFSMIAMAVLAVAAMSVQAHAAVSPVDVVNSMSAPTAVFGGSVPEPASLSLLAVGAVGLVARRNRRSR